jgi:hypothetical protein
MGIQGNQDGSINGPSSANSSTGNLDQVVDHKLLNDAASIEDVSGGDGSDHEFADIIKVQVASGTPSVRI